MVTASMFFTGISLLFAGGSLIFFNRPISEKRRIDKAYEELEYQAKKDKLMPMRNADINLFGLLRY